MPKRFSNGHFVRRIRRELAQKGIEVELIWKTRPNYQNIMPSVILESRTRLPGDDNVYIAHHGTREPHVLRDVERIIYNLSKERPGVPETRINEYAKMFGQSLRTGEDMYALVEVGYGAYPRILVPVEMFDILGRKYQMVMASNNAISDQEIPFQETYRNLDQRLRDRKGNFKPIKIGLIAQEIIKSRGCPKTVAKDIIPRLTETLEKMRIEDGFGYNSVVEIKSVRQNSLSWRLSAGKIEVINWVFKDGKFNGNTVLIRGSYPESVIKSMIGKRLGDVVQGLPISPDLIIKKANSVKKPWEAVSLQFEGKPKLLSEFIESLEKTE